MPDRARPFWRTAGGPIGGVLAVLAVLVLLVGVAVADEDAGGDPVRVDGPLRFEVADGGRIGVDRDTRYLDTIELRSGPSGPLLINELSMDDYVAGIAEMPADWPMEALKAQAVAARTYGWYVMTTGRYPGYDICATVSCQVFRGADVVLGSSRGDRWQEAVDATSGEVLVDAEGGPVLARYFSTSGGRTYANEEVFPSTGAHDHLVAIEDPYDAVSPYHRWTVRFTREQFDTLAARGERLAATVPVAAAERVGEVDDPRALIRVTGQDGTVVEVGAGELRDFLSRVAPDSFPGLYPPPREDGLRSLPSTVPTARYGVEVTDDEVILHGQGWGHGVGMGQYGARGRAEEGASYLDILSAYYNGLVPEVAEDVPDRIRVGMAGSDEVTVGADDALTLRAGDEVVADDVLGTWHVVRDGEGWILTPPDGHDRPLEVAATVRPEASRSLADAVTVETDVNKPVRLFLEVAREDGGEVLRRELGVVDAGRHAAVWRLDDEDGSLVGAGRYHVALVGEDHTGARAGDPTAVELPLAGDGSATADEPSLGGVDTNLLRTTALIAALIAILTGVLLIIRRTR